MNFDLSEEQHAIFDMAQAFGRDRLAPHALAWDAAEMLPRDVLREAAALGMAAITVRSENHGTGLSRLDGTLIFEGLSYGCPSVAAFLSIHNMVGGMIDTFGTEPQRERFLPALATYDAMASYCLTEPGSGSDAAALRTTAVRDGTGYRLNGTKAFISGAGVADLYVVMARTGAAGPSGISSFLVDKATPGLSFGANERKMGWKAQPTAQVQFDDCWVPADALLGGEEGEGFRFAMRGLDGGRLNIAACSLGAAQSALDITVRYMGERQAFGRPIDQFQALQFRLADMETNLQAARVFLRQAAWKLDVGAVDATQHCAMAKRFVTDVGFEVVNEALQLHGGYGYLTDYGIEKLVRDLRVHQILEGTNEIMRLIVARGLLADQR